MKPHDRRPACHLPAYLAPLSACLILALIGRAPAHGQSPPAPVTQPALIAQAEADLKAGRYAEALARFRALPPASNPAQARARRLVAASIEFQWGKSLLTSSPALAVPHLQAALAADSALRPPAVADDLTDLGVASLSLGRYAQAQGSFRQAVPLYRRSGDGRGEANALTDLGAASLDLGQYEVDIQAQQSALTLFRRVGDRAGEAGALTNLGVASNGLHQYARALGFFRQALPALRQTGDAGGQAITLNNMGVATNNLGRPAEALVFYRQSLPLYHQAGNRAGEAGALKNIALVRQRLGK